MRRCAKNLGLNILFKSGHDADRTDQSRDTEGDTGDGDDRIEGDGPVAAFGAQISQPDKDFDREEPPLLLGPELREENDVADGRLVR